MLTLKRQREFQLPDTGYMLTKQRCEMVLQSLNTKHILTLPFPSNPNTGCVYTEKSAGTENPLMMLCFQESLNCYGGRPTASPPTLAMQTERPKPQESRRPMLVPHPCSPLYAAVYTPASPWIPRAAVLPLRVPGGVDVRLPLCWSRLLSGSSPLCPSKLPAHHPTLVLSYSSTLLIPLPLSLGFFTETCGDSQNLWSSAVTQLLLLLYNTPGSIFYQWTQHVDVHFVMLEARFVRKSLSGKHSSHFILSLYVYILLHKIYMLHYINFT